MSIRSWLSDWWFPSFVAAACLIPFFAVGLILICKDERAMKIVKAGVTLETVDGGSCGHGRVVKDCTCYKCSQVSHWQRFRQLPCGCYHAAHISCTCRIGETKCNRCGRIFVNLDGGWYEIEDPHKKKEG